MAKFYVACGTFRTTVSVSSDVPLDGAIFAFRRLRESPDCEKHRASNVVWVNQHGFDQRQSEETDLPEGFFDTEKVMQLAWN